jgi:peptide deformylase
LRSNSHPVPARSAPGGKIAECEHRLHRLSLVLYPDPVLRTVCPPVEVFDSSLRDLVQEMIDLMQSHGGVGLAAPQVALEQRVLVAAIEGRPLCLANPEVRDASESADFLEGCLSLPGIRVNVPRPERIRVTGFDPCGQKTSFGATGLWARVIQHELDHLNGVLICDRGHPVEEKCAQCPLMLSTVLLEERKQRSRPHSRLPMQTAPKSRPYPPGDLSAGIL